MIYRETLQISTRGKGTYEITAEVERVVKSSGVKEGIVTVFNVHTSSSLVLMENADPSARDDLEEYFERLVPEDATYFTHVYEGGGRYAISY